MDSVLLLKDCGVPSDVVSRAEAQLRGAGYSVALKTQKHDFLSALQITAPDLLIIFCGEQENICSMIYDLRRMSDCPLLIQAKPELCEPAFLEAGADDVLFFGEDEDRLKHKVAALVRRFRGRFPLQKSGVVLLGETEINLQTCQIIVKGKRQKLPRKELQLLFLLASHFGKVFSRDRLLDMVWGIDFFGSARTVDVHIKRIRNRLIPADSSLKVVTVWGVGYKLEYSQNN